MAPPPGWKALRRLLSRALPPRRHCDICGRQFRPGKMTTACLDHLEKQGMACARGWLCGACNVGIGMADENPRILRAQASYLEARGHLPRRPLIS